LHGLIRIYAKDPTDNFEKKFQMENVFGI